MPEMLVRQSFPIFTLFLGNLSSHGAWKEEPRLPSSYHTPDHRGLDHSAQILQGTAGHTQGCASYIYSFRAPPPSLDIDLRDMEMVK